MEASCGGVRNRSDRGEGLQSDVGPDQTDRVQSSRPRGPSDGASPTHAQAALEEGVLEPDRMSWHSLLLVFHEERLEAKYTEHFMSRVLVEDRFNTWSHTFVTGMIVASQAFRARSSAGEWVGTDIFGVALWNLMLLGAVFLHTVLVHVFSRRTLLCWRTVIVAGVRMLVMVIFCVGSIPHFNPDPLVKTWQSLWLQVLYNTAILSLSGQALGFPVMFKYHVWLQSLFMVVPMMTLPRRFCARLALSDQLLTNQVCLVPGMEGQPVDGSCLAPSAVTFSCEGHLSVLYGVLTRTTNFLLGPFLGAMTELPSSQSMCWMSIVYLQIALGWFLPTTVLYMLERKSRAYFLLHVAQDHQVDLLPLQVEEELEQSTHILDRLCRLVLFLQYLARSLLFLLMLWQLLLMVSHVGASGVKP